MTRPPLVFLLLAGLTSLYGWAVFISTFHAPGSIGLNYNAPGTDYMVFDTAMRLARSGDLATLYDGDRFTQALNDLFQTQLREPLPFRPWIYPPLFLSILLPFAPLGFYASYAVFQIVSAAAMAYAIRLITASRSWAFWAALLCPAASISVVSGQSSFLVAALLTTGTALLNRNPIAAGVIFGLLTFKPQFFLLVPVFLLANRAWLTSAAGVATFLVLALLPVILFGPEIWTGWFGVFAESTSGKDPRWFLYGRVWGESVYTCVYLFGAGHGVANIAQWAATLLAAGCVWSVSRGTAALDLRAAALLTASLLAAPHSGGYDLVLLVCASALLLNHLGTNAGRGDWWLCLLTWLLPLFGIPAHSVIGRFGPILAMVLLGRIMLLSGAWRGK